MIASGARAKHKTVRQMRSKPAGYCSGATWQGIGYLFEGQSDMGIRAS